MSPATPAPAKGGRANWCHGRGRGLVRYYRAGIDFNHLDRLFERFKEARINLAMLQTVTPEDLQSAEYKRYKGFIDRCHAAGIKVVFDGGTGNVRLNAISLDSVLLHPEWRDWIAKDDLGFPRWRTPGRSFWTDVKNSDYRKEVLKAAEIAVDSGADAFYYDWAIGGTSDLMRFFNDVRGMTDRKGKNIPIYGNCKGNILVEEHCDHQVRGHRGSRRRGWKVGAQRRSGTLLLCRGRRLEAL